MWANWMAAVLRLRPAFKRLRTFQWFVIILAAMSVRKDLMGVTSFVRSINISPCFYTSILHFFHSTAIDLKKLTELWFSFVFEKFTNKFLINGQIVLLGDGIKIGKEGQNMPAVKLLHQDSQSNSKAEYIMGHSFQAISILICFCFTAISVPLICRIHEGIRTGPRDRKTLMDKFLTLILELNIQAKTTGAYLVADAYYACGKLAKLLKKEGIKLITRVRKNAVAFFAAEAYSGIGRPRKYGEKVKLWDLFSQLDSTMLSPIYGDQSVSIRYKIIDLFWKAYGDIVRFCLIDYPGKGKVILMSVDTSLSAKDIITAYGFRFKIEYSFKELVHMIGGFCYRFWAMAMKKIKRGEGDRFIHREPEEMKKKIFQKIFSYNLHVQMALIAHGLLQYLSAHFSDAVWSNFGSWLRTIRPGIPASANVVQESLRNQLYYFRHILPKDTRWGKWAKKILGKDPPATQKAA